MKRVIKAAADANFDFESYGIDPRKFDWKQMYEIRDGLKSGVDISVYADPKFDAEQMQQIRYGLESGFDVRWYADPKFDYYQMNEIRMGLESGVDVSQYADPEIDWVQMNDILHGLVSGKSPILKDDFDYYDTEDVPTVDGVPVDFGETYYRATVYDITDPDDPELLETIISATPDKSEALNSAKTYLKHHSKTEGNLGAVVTIVEPEEGANPDEVDWYETKTIWTSWDADAK